MRVRWTKVQRFGWRTGVGGSGTESGDPVFIWGSFPEVYWKADRPPGGGLVHSYFVTGLSGGRDAGPDTLKDATPGAEALLLRNLRDHPPALVLDTSTANLRRRAIALRAWRPRSQ